MTFRFFRNLRVTENNSEPRRLVKIFALSDIKIDKISIMCGEFDFRRVRKIVKRECFLLHVCPSVCVYGEFLELNCHNISATMTKLRIERPLDWSYISYGGWGCFFRHHVRSTSPERGSLQMSKAAGDVTLNAFICILYFLRTHGHVCPFLLSLHRALLNYTRGRLKWCTEVGCLMGLNPPTPNSEVLTKLSRIPSFVLNTSVTT
jgi:hypothetical protein